MKKLLLSIATLVVFAPLAAAQVQTETDALETVLTLTQSYIEPCPPSATDEVYFCVNLNAPVKVTKDVIDLYASRQGWTPLTGWEQGEMIGSYRSFAYHDDFNDLWAAYFSVAEGAMVVKFSPLR